MLDKKARKVYDYVRNVPMTPQTHMQVAKPAPQPVNRKTALSAPEKVRFVVVAGCVERMTLTQLRQMQADFSR